MVHAYGNLILHRQCLCAACQGEAFAARSSSSIDILISSLPLVALCPHTHSCRQTRNNTVSGVGSSSSSSSAAIGIKVEGSQARIARPNEDTALVDQDLPAALFRDRDIRPTDDSDSDASADATGGNGRIEEGREVWPPRQLDPLAPVQLPLGPATVAMRRHLATQPILADPSDPAALEHEELASLFLVQLPSTLNLPQPSSAATAPARSVGKMRLHRSGRVSLVTPEGQVYNVNTGLAASFQQCLMSVHLAASEGPAAGGAALASSSTSSAPASGSLCLMGQVTKKLVVTPTVQDYMLSLQNDRRGTGAQSGEKMERVEADSGEEAEAVLVEDG